MSATVEHECRPCGWYAACAAHDWRGPASHDYATAEVNARIHDELKHADDQGRLW